MLDLLGADYLIAHIVHAANEERDRDQYRAYVTDALMTIADNTHNHVIYTKSGADVAEIGGKLTKSWAEIYRHAKAKPAEDKRTGDEIAADVIRRAGLIVN